MTIRIEHAGLWVRDLDGMRAFYAGVLGGKAGPPYHNRATGFSSCFVSFRDGCRVELMHRADVPDGQGREVAGLAHLALAVGDRAAVDAEVERLRQLGVTILSVPRVTGDGYYEAVIQDPEGNRLELMARAEPRPEQLVFAIITVAGATKAGADHGDAAALRQLEAFYALCAETVTAVHGRVVKALGDGVLASFPLESLREAAAALRALQAAATAQWQSYDARCRVQVKLGTGTVMAGVFGPPGQESYDIYGNALSQLFKLPGGDFVLSPDAAVLDQAS